jgi:thioredoxin 1
MSAHLSEVGDASFAAEVVRSEVPVLVDFWAPRCGPCRALEPDIEALAIQYGGRVRFRKLNVDEHLETPQSYGVRAIPTLLLFKGGAVVGQWVGAASGMRRRLDEALEKVLR